MKYKEEKFDQVQSSLIFVIIAEPKRMLFKLSPKFVPKLSSSISFALKGLPFLR